MFDRQINSGCVAAWGLWGLSICFTIVGSIFHSIDIGRASILLCGGAVTMTIRQLLARQERIITTALIVSDRAGGEVRPLK